MKPSILVAALALVCAAPPAQAQTAAQNETECYNVDESVDHPDAVIAACTALIDAGGQPAENMSNFYLLRGNAYENKSLDSQAVADWRQALKLNPHNDQAGMALMMKGVSP